LYKDDIPRDDCTATLAGYGLSSGEQLWEIEADTAKTDDLLKGSPHLAPYRPEVGIAPQLSDAELITLAVMQAMLVIGIGINMVLIAFNLIPIPPLDGSHVMKYLLPRPLAIRYQQLGSLGLLILIALLVFGGRLLDLWLRPAMIVTQYLAVARLLSHRLLVMREGEAVEVTDPQRLSSLVDAFRDKYDDWFQFRLKDGRFTAPGATAPVLVYDVRARKAFGFTKGDTFSQTRWRF
jgi:hypothetical protein